MRRRDQRTIVDQAAFYPGWATSPRVGQTRASLWLILLTFTISAIGTETPSAVGADEPAAAEQAAAPADVSTEDPDVDSVEEPSADQKAEPPKQTIPIPDHWKRLGKPDGSEVWLDLKNKSVIVAGHTCLTRGGLEMFVCPINTKEHESVIAAHATAAEVHAALLAIGAEAGKPVQWEPVQKSASGSIIEVRVTWHDPASNRPMTRWGKEMVRNFRDGTGLSHDWVFGGSILEKDPDSSESYYYADSGPLLCVSNFATACIDINVPSSATDGNLLYEANTPNLPAEGTKVYLQLTPGKLFAGD